MCSDWLLDMLCFRNSSAALFHLRREFIKENDILQMQFKTVSIIKAFAKERYVNFLKATFRSFEE